MAQVSVTFCLPALPSSRLPQSVQKMSEPIADISLVAVSMHEDDAVCEEKVTGSRELCGEQALPRLQR
jgi:hypothetical protein